MENTEKKNNFAMFNLTLTEKEMVRLQRSYLIESKPFVAEIEKVAKEQKVTNYAVYASVMLKQSINARFEDAQKRTLALVEKAIETLKAQGLDATVMESQLEVIKSAIKAENDEK